jgi:putative ABC transport system substrate-binding protein
MADAQPPAGTIPRIGVLFPAEPPDDPNVAAFRKALQDLGYVEGHTVIVEYRHADGRTDRFPDVIAELVRLHVHVIVVGSTPAARAAQHATSTIPIVFIASNPVRTGLVASIARPGGNMTGPSFAYDEEFAAKWVQFLKEAAPKSSRVGILRDPTNPAAATFVTGTQMAARALTLKLQLIEASEPDQIERAFATMTRERTGALIVDGSPFFVAHRSRIVGLAAQHRLPAMYGFRLFVDAGGLMSYSIDLAELWRRAAAYADRILKGARPGELPVEQATKYELVINLRTAKTLGLTIPKSLLLRADQVIE